MRVSERRPAFTWSSMIGTSVCTPVRPEAQVGHGFSFASRACGAWSEPITSGTLPFGSRLALRPRGVARTPEALLDANRAAAPFMMRYALIVGVLAVLVILVAPFSDIAAVIVHLVAIVMVCLGAWVCWAKARRAAASSSVVDPTVGTTDAARPE